MATRGVCKWRWKERSFFCREFPWLLFSLLSFLFELASDLPLDLARIPFSWAFKFEPKTNQTNSHNKDQDCSTHARLNLKIEIF
jgi:hypothetical protein